MTEKSDGASLTGGTLQLLALQPFARHLDHCRGLGLARKGSQLAGGTIGLFMAHVEDHHRIV
jgi:hypothetical protein